MSTDELEGEQGVVGDIEPDRSAMREQRATPMDPGTPAWMISSHMPQRIEAMKLVNQHDRQRL